MEFSTVPFFVVGILGFAAMLVARASREAFLDGPETRSLYAFLAAVSVWGFVSTVMGVRGLHATPWLLREVPLLWQSFVVILLLCGFYTTSRRFRHGLKGLARGSSTRWLVWIQALRIGAIGSVAKTLGGEITSGFPLWVGIPDFLFGVSVPIVGWLLHRGHIGERGLAIWAGIGAAIILVPTFGFMPHWMSEPGFRFIFEFPMVLAPSIVVPVLVLLNLLLAGQQLMKARTRTALTDTDRNELSGKPPACLHGSAQVLKRRSTARRRNIRVARSIGRRSDVLRARRGELDRAGGGPRSRDSCETDFAPRASRT